MQSSSFRVGDLEVQSTGRVALVTIDRPQKLNAMTAAFWGDLRNVLDRLTNEHDTRAIVITGAGPRAFSAGGDIQGFLELRSEEDIRAYQRDAMEAFAHVERCPVIVIAAVNGIAFGGGCELALACDFVIAGEQASFAMPEANLGLVPGFGIIRSPDMIGAKMTKYLVATGDCIDAATAMQAGLAQRVVADATLLDEAMQIAERVASRSPQALAVGKKLVNAGLETAAIEASIAQVSQLQAHRDRQQGIAAFLERRAPAFGRREDVPR